jgi:hypothetical protein
MKRTLGVFGLRLGALAVALGMCLGVPHALFARVGWGTADKASSGLLAAGASAGAGQQKPGGRGGTPGKAKGPVTHVVIGEIVSASDTSLVVSHGRGKAKKEDTFTLTSETKKEGEPAAGDRARIYYRAEGTEMTATRVDVLPKAKPKAKAKAKPPV